MAMQMMRSANQGAYRIRGANQQDDPRDFLYQVPIIQVNSHTGLSVGPQVAPTVTRQFQKGLCISAFRINNRSAAAGVLGIGYCWDNILWNWGTWVNATNTFTDDTADAQSSAAGDITLFNAVGEAATDGWMIFSTRPFSWISIDVSQASVGATTFAVAYTNAAGTAWTTLIANQPLVDQMTIAASVVPIGEQIFCWNPPTNWGKITNITGLTRFNGMYGFRVTIDAATITTSALATAIEIGSMYYSAEAIADNASGSEDNISFVDYDAIGVVALIPAAVIGSNVDFYLSHAG